jgi:hypothetical protein
MKNIHFSNKWRIISRIIPVSCLVVLAVIPLGSRSIADAADPVDSGAILTEQLGRAMFPENWVDFTGKPCPVKLEDYRANLAKGYFPPDKVVIGNRTFKVGKSESSLNLPNDSLCHVTEAPVERTREENNQYLSDLLRAMPTTTHYYVLYPLADQQGWFKVVEYNNHDCISIRIFLRAATKEGPYRVYLIHVKMPEIPQSEVSLKSTKTGLIATRKDRPAAKWNIVRNSLEIQCE